MMQFTKSILLCGVLTLLSSAFAQSTAENDFRVIVLPDTQHYSESYPSIFNAQTEWIAANAAQMNIQFVLGLGDIVNEGSYVSQWNSADTAIKLLDQANIPYVLPPGNHDYANKKPSTRDLTLFNTYFGPARYASNPHYQGSYPAGSNANQYGVFTVGSRTFLVLALELFPRQATLNWASSVVAANPDKEVIVITHSYMYLDNSRIGRCDQANAESFGLGTDNDGEEMWSKFVSQHPNITLVLNGHSHGTGRRSDAAFDGHVVHQLLADYQSDSYGGNGYLRILKFRPSLDVIEVSTYSPYRNTWKTDSANQFTLKWHDRSAGTNATGYISGRVRNAACTNLANATVSVPGAVTHSDSQGWYKLLVPAGTTYNPIADASGYLPQTKSATVWSGFATSTDFFLSISSTSSCTANLNSVKICTPSAGSTTASPLHVVGAAASNYPISYMQVYVDYVKMTTVFAASLDKYFSLGPGSHRLTVQAKDSSGAFFKQTIYVTVN